MRKSNLLLPLLMLCLFAACKKDEATPGAPAQTLLDVKYGTDSLQNMDVYLPANRTTTATKVLVMIHGGAWSALDKTNLNGYVDSMKKRFPDYAIFNINHTLATITKPTTTIFPRQENDVKAAIDFIKGKSADYLIGNKYVLFGTSSGAHLALLQAYKYSNSVVPKAVVDLYGPTDMAAMFTKPAQASQVQGIYLLMGGKTPKSDSTFYANSSPINFVQASSPATIIFHGGIDTVVRVDQSTVLRDKLTVKNVVNQYVYYPNAGHGGTWDAATTKDAFDKIQAFLIQNVK